MTWLPGPYRPHARPSPSKGLADGHVWVANSLVACNRGQEDMAGEFQRQMVASASSGDFSYFEAHGYKDDQ